MIDKDIIRTKTEDKAIAAFTLHVEGRKLLTDYAKEYIREVVKLLLVEVFAKKLEAEALYERIMMNAAVPITKVVLATANKYAQEILAQGPEAYRDMIKEVMEGSDKE